MNFKNKKIFSIDNLLFVIALLVIVFIIIPRAWKNFLLQGQEAAKIVNLVSIHNEPLEITPPYALVFWATWCKPCDIELGRIQSMIEENKIPQNKVIAVAVDDHLKPILEAQAKRNYSFPIVWDEDQSLSSMYQVQGTPTILVIQKDNTIKWATTGLSPLLKLRLQSYLN
ncbi:MAG: TlpA family protein disulfide reductase [Bdellovibrionaceae bacterium]|nr:TlpA family protein disulfide reductase [Pseudobdellovibrionaceae bacterium]